MDSQIKQYEREFACGDYSNYQQYVTALRRAGRLRVVTKFADMHSGGGSKTAYSIILIEAPESIAEAAFTRVFKGIDIYGAACECCGPNFKVEEYSDIYQATGFERRCAFDEHISAYVERSSSEPYLTFNLPYLTLEEALEQHDDWFYLRYEDLTPEEQASIFDLRPNPRSCRPYEAFDYEGRSTPRQCVECGAPTRKGKPYCPDHVELSSYAQSLQAQISQDPNSIIETDCMSYLFEQPMTAALLAKWLKTSVKVIQPVLDKLESEGRIQAKPRKTRKGIIDEYCAVRKLRRNPCEVCNSPTQKGKHYCPEHIGLMPHVQELQRLIAEGEEEVAQVEKRGVQAIRPDSYILTDIIAQLREQGPQHLKNLAELVDVSPDALQFYCDYLVQQGVAEWGTIENNKGRPTQYLFLTGEKYKPAERTIGLEQLAEAYAVVPETIRRWARQGAPHTRTRTDWLFNEVEFEHWYQEHLKRGTGKRKDRAFKRRARLLEGFDVANRQRNLTRLQAAEVFGVTDHTLDDWVRRGAPHDLEMIGGIPLRLFNRAELAAWRRKDIKRAKRKHVKSLRKGISSRKPEGYMTPNQICIYMGWPSSREAAVRRYGLQQGAPHERVGKFVYFPPAEFKAWFEEFEGRQSHNLQKFMEAGAEAVKEKVARLKEEATHRTLTRQELAEAAGVSVGAVDNWVRWGVPHDEAAPVGGHKGSKIRLFNLEEVQEWREELKLKADEKRAAWRESAQDISRAAGHSPEKWQQILDYLDQGHSTGQAAEHFGVSAGGIRQYIRKVGYERKPIQSSRALGRKEAAEKLGIAAPTLYKWVTKFGAPHEIRGTVTGAKPLMFFNLEELQEWRRQTGRRRQLRRRRRRA